MLSPPNAVANAMPKASRAVNLVIILFLSCSSSLRLGARVLVGGMIIDAGLNHIRKIWPPSGFRLGWNDRVAARVATCRHVYVPTELRTTPARRVSRSDS